MKVSLTRYFRCRKFAVSQRGSRGQTSCLECLVSPIKTISNKLFKQPATHCGSCQGKWSVCEQIPNYDKCNEIRTRVTFGAFGYRCCTCSGVLGDVIRILRRIRETKERMESDRSYLQENF